MTANTILVGFIVGVEVGELVGVNVEVFSEVDDGEGVFDGEGSGAIDAGT